MTPNPTNLPSSGHAHFDIYGYRVRVECANASVLGGLADDFAFFQSTSANANMVVTLTEAEPDYSLWAKAQPRVYTPRNVAYRQNGKTIIDYSGRALGVYDVDAGRFHLSSLHPDLLYEAAFLFLLSRIGEELDAIGLHRIHALGVTAGGPAGLVLLPMGGGKSTLGAALLQHQETRLLSDDSPLIDRHGGVLAFPLRIGLLPGSEGSIPPDQLRQIQRMEFGPKLVVNYKYFSGRVCGSAKAGIIFIGERGLDSDCTLRPATRLAAWKALLANCVVGLGLFQGMEFLFGRSAKEMASGIPILFSRLRACRRLLRGSKVYHLRLGRDFERNASVVIEALRDL
jgi:hypothetical protein